MPSAKKEKPESIGSRIAQARRELAVRERKDVSQSDIAERLGVAQATVNRWENDKEGKRPSDENLLELARILGVTPSWLRYGQEPKHPPLDESKLTPVDLPTTTKNTPRKGRTG